MTCPVRTSERNPIFKCPPLRYPSLGPPVLWGMANHRCLTPPPPHLKKKTLSHSNLLGGVGVGSARGGFCKGNEYHYSSGSARAGHRIVAGAWGDIVLYYFRRKRHYRMNALRIFGVMVARHYPKNFIGVTITVEFRNYYLIISKRALSWNFLR